MLILCKVCGGEVEVPVDTRSVICSGCTMSRAGTLETELERLRRALRRLEDKGAKHSNEAHKIGKEILSLDVKLKEVKDHGSNE